MAVLRLPLTGQADVWKSDELTLTLNCECGAQLINCVLHRQSWDRISRHSRLNGMNGRSVQSAPVGYGGRCGLTKIVRTIKAVELGNLKESVAVGKTVNRFYLP